jgi:aryl-alcohol dehydrogenase-like predicted oxidoreductase
MSLRKRKLGRTGLQVSELGFGCSSYWAKPAFPEAQALSLVAQAIEAGITFFDTGPSYAAGNAERRLGKALRLAGKRDDLVICSKVGTHVADNGRIFRDWSANNIKTSIRGSLERLQIDRLDGVHLHGPRIADITPELCEALLDLQQQGLIGFIGLNSFDAEVVRFGLTIPMFDSFMIEYNIIRKRNALLLDEITASGAAAVVGTPIAQALFRKSIWPKNLKEAWEMARALRNHRDALRIARQYRFLNEISGMTGGQAALAYVLQNSAFSTAVFGTTSPEHLRLNLQAAEISLPSDVLQRVGNLADAIDTHE